MGELTYFRHLPISLTPGRTVTIDWGWNGDCRGYSLQLFAFKKTDSSGSYDGIPIGRITYPRTSTTYTIPSDATEIYFKGTLYNDGFAVAGYYQTDPVINNRNFPPNSPSHINASPSSQVSDGGYISLSWSRETDFDGDDLTYELTAEYTKKDGSPENDIIYSGSNIKYSYNIPSGKYKSVRFKVRSKDSNGAYSPSYAYTETIQVVTNRPPTTPSNIYATLTR